MRPVNVGSIGSYIREQREQAKISIRQLAQAAGVSNPYLSQVERGLRRPSADILQQIAKGLRISAEALYVQAGILDDKEGETSVTEAILADTEITERQKQMLIDIYESFRKEVRADAAAARAAAAERDPVADADSRHGTAAREPVPAGVWAEAGVEAGADDVVAGDEAESATAVPAGADPVADALADAELRTDPPAAGSR